jgi:uncharacterized membrane protein YhiD involved in acid resistance
MMEWEFLRRVLIVTLIVLLIIILYRKLLRLVGGKERFNNKYAFMAPLVSENGNEQLLTFELPENDTVKIIVQNSNAEELAVIVDTTELNSGKHSYTFSRSALPVGAYELVLITHNQRIERRI